MFGLVPADDGEHMRQLLLHGAATLQHSCLVRFLAIRLAQLTLEPAQLPLMAADMKPTEVNLIMLVRKPPTLPITALWVMVVPPTLLVIIPLPVRF